jgi:hypothetical protein
MAFAFVLVVLGGTETGPRDVAVAADEGQDLFQDEVGDDDEVCGEEEEEEVGRNILKLCSFVSSCPDRSVD